MAIRSIKGELREHLPFASLTDPAARLFVMLYTLADDGGRCPASPSYLAGAVFFARQKSANVIGQLITELEAADLVRRYVAKGGTFIQIVGWSDKGSPTYQYIKPPHYLRYPAPEASDDGRDDRRDDRPRGGTDLDLDPDREKEKEKEGNARARKASRGNGAAPPRAPSASLVAFFSEAYARAYGGSAPTWTERNRKLLGDLEAEHGELEVRKRIANMFGDPDRKEFPRGPYDLATLVTHFDKFARATGRVRIEQFTDDDYTRPVEGLPMQRVPATNGVGHAHDFGDEEDF
jgi:hypothetical protein